MSDAAVQRMTAEEFLLWREGRPGTWELVDGLLYETFFNGPSMMAGGRRNHTVVSGNVLIASTRRLRGGRRRPITGDLAVRMPRGNVRQPDVSIDCGAGSGEDRARRAQGAVRSAVAFHPPHRPRAQAGRGRCPPGLAHFVVMEPDKPEATVWARPGGEGAWTSATVRGLDAEMELAEFGVSLPMAEVYEGVKLSEA